MKNKVKEIYFEQGSSIPVFLMENGDIKKACSGTVNGYDVLFWITKEEGDIIAKKILESKTNAKYKSKWWIW